MRRFGVLVALGISAAALGLGAAEPGPRAAAGGGGTLRIVLPAEAVPTLDPAVDEVGTFWGALWYGTCGTLLAFRDSAGPRGFTLRPEAAVGPPQVSADGRTYVFTVRRGLRFSNGSLLTAANFAHALGRVRNPIMRSPGAALYADVRDVKAIGRRLRIVLKRPSGDLPVRLALGYACPVPLGFSLDPTGVPLMVASGPYFVSRYDTARQLVLERNRYYRGSRPHRVDRVVITLSGVLDDLIRTVETGRADVLGANLPRWRSPVFASRYGVNKRQYFQVKGTFIVPLTLNTSRPLFRNNVPLRKAINLALDRAAIVRAAEGGAVAHKRTDQLLTHWMPTWVDHRLYPLTGPNLRRARKLAAPNLRAGKAILWVSSAQQWVDQIEIITRNLDAIGLDVEVKAMSTAVMNARGGVPGADYDMMFAGLPLDYPDPANVIVRLLGGENARKPAGNVNFAYFDVRAYNRRMAAADRLVGAARLRAFSQLDADIMRNEAPWVPLYEVSSALFVGTHVGCLKMHPVFRIDFAAMCLR